MKAGGIVRLVIVLLGVVSLPLAGWAQQASGIAGLVTDSTGGVLPGVTVEAASPVLIEKVRTAVTDGQGRYNVVELRPGVYTVTFRLPGFSTVVREGVELRGGFTATVNGQLRVGSLEETVTVTGASPQVDVQNIRQQSVISDELLAALPTSSKSLVTVVNIIPGMVGAGDVGGGSGIYTSNATYRNMYHGQGGVKFSYDGLRTNNLYNATSYVMNAHTAEETVVQTGGTSAESAASGVTINFIPKEGSNKVSFLASGFYTNDNFQSNNLTDELIARGLTHTNKAHFLYDSSVSVGGPIQRDKLWFFTAGRVSGTKIQVPAVFFNATQGTMFYTPGEPAYRQEWLKGQAVRLTWQASEKNKVNVFADVQSFTVRGRGEFASPEAAVAYNFWPQGLYQTTWTWPATNRLLFEAGASLAKGPFHFPSPGDRFMRVSPDDISILELSTGLRYNSRATYLQRQQSDRWVQRVSASYVTGTHKAKVGVQLEEGVDNSLNVVHQDVNYSFLRAVPTRITQRATPYEIRNRFMPDLGLYAQDQWTMSRLTLNVGLRFDYFRGYVPAQQVPAGRFVPAREFGPVDDVPAWKDINPRLGAAYDLFGNGRTALKVSLGRYVQRSAIEIPSANNPITTSVNTVNRTWNDSNGNYVPDCDLNNPAANGECGDFDNLNFGKRNISTRFADDVLRGFGARNSMWDFGTQIQHELRTGVSVSAGYYRNWSSHFRVTDNLEVSPADYDPFCITAPVDRRLPGGGGYQVCGLYDVSPTKFGRVNNLVTQASNFFSTDASVNCDYNGSLVTSGGALAVGSGSDFCGQSDFLNATFDVRLKSGALFGGGVDTGRTVFDSCYVVDSPQQLQFCRVVRPFGSQTQVKLHGSYPLPGDFLVSAAFQNTPGPTIEANYQATNAEIAPSLGRNLAACGTRAVCTATVTVPIVAPMQMFEGRRSQVDLRMSKRFRVGPRLSLRANVDVYNVFNASSVLGLNQTYGPQWQVPFSAGTALEALLQGRMIQVGGEMRF